MKRNLIRESVLNLDSYIPEPQEAEIVVNANENPYNLPKDLRDRIGEEIKDLKFNRYPDPQSNELRSAFSEITGIPKEQILAGSGLDEVLSIIANTFIEPGDYVVTHAPGFSMYKVWSEIAGAKVVEVEDLENHKIDIDGLVDMAIRYNAKIIFICSPNNPTGQTINLQELEELLEATPSLIVLDEAYADFSDQSFIDLTRNYDNLLVLRTMSKAYRIPGARCGFVAGPVDIIEAMNKVKAPYNLNSLTQKVAQIVLENQDELEPGIEEIKNQRGELQKFLLSLPEVEVTPSQANFIYFTTPNYDKLLKAFEENGILVRHYPGDQAFRLTVGSPEENKVIKQVIKETLDETNN